MNFNIGDIVTRISYKHDILFKIINFDGNKAYLKGVDVRLFADSNIDDLVKSNIDHYSSDSKIINENLRDLNLDRSNYFYLPGKILHIDADNYLSNYDETLIK